jgi:hypothetical protein
MERISPSCAATMILTLFCCKNPSREEATDLSGKTPTLTSPSRDKPKQSTQNGNYIDPAVYAHIPYAFCPPTEVNHLHQHLIIVRHSHPSP